MPRSEPRLTDDLYRRLEGTEVDRFADLAILVCTVDEGGWPHPAMLSYYEVAATDPETLQLAIYSDSRTCANMRARGRAALIVVDDGLVCYVRGSVREVAPAMTVAAYNAHLTLRITNVTFDAPPPDLEPGSFVTTGIRYRPRMGPALDRARAALAELRGHHPL